MIDWEVIKEEYLNTQMGQKAIAKKYGISHNAIEKRALSEGWWDEKKQRQSHVSAVPLSVKLERLTEQLTDKVGEAIDQLELDWIKGESFETGLVDTQKMRHIIQSIKDLKELVNDDGNSDAKQSQSELIEVIKKAVRG